MKLSEKSFDFLRYEGTCISEACNILHVSATYYYNYDPASRTVEPLICWNSIVKDNVVKTKPIFAFVGAGYPVSVYFVIGSSVFSIPFDMYQLYRFSEWCCIISAFYNPKKYF